MKAIRWPGFITFILFIGLIVGGTLLFSESLIKSFTESTLTDLNGAKVEIDSVTVSYSPLGIKYHNIQVTDPDNTMTNMLQIEKAGFSLSFGDLLLKKLIIDDMSITGIKVDTPRKSSGAIKKPVKTDKKTDKPESSVFDFAMPDIDLPDVDDLINKEQLNSEKLITDLNNDLDTTRNNWQSISNDIQDKKRWDSYQARYDRIKTDIKGNTTQKIAAIKDAKELSKDLKAELDKIKKARQQFNIDTKRLDDKFTAAKHGPRDDIRNLKEKYRLDDPGTQNISSMLFGEKTAEYIVLAEKWYKRLKPYIEDSPEEIAEKQARERKLGTNVKFREFDPKPDFYVRKAAIDAEIPRGQFTGSITEISSDQTINKKPMRMVLSGNNMRHRDSESFEAIFNYTRPEQGYSQFTYDMKSYQLTNFKISSNKKLPLTMEKGLLDINIGSKLSEGVFTGTGNALFKSVNFQSSTNSSSSFTKMLATSFRDISNFNINARFSGSLHNLNLRLDSDLDNMLGQQLKNQLKQRSDQFEQKLKDKIDLKLKEPLEKIDQQRKKLDQIKNTIDAKEKEIQQKINDIENKIKNSSQSDIDRKKDELKDKLKLKLKL